MFLNVKNVVDVPDTHLYTDEYKFLLDRVGVWMKDVVSRDNVLPQLKNIICINLRDI